MVYRLPPPCTRVSGRLPDVRFFHASGFNVLMVSYRGFGASEGTPGERGIRLDAAAALEYVADLSDVLDTSRIYLFGRSIGGAAAIALAASPKARGLVRGLVVENTFTSIDNMIDVVFPVLRFAKPLNRNKWNSYSEISKIEVPILFMRSVSVRLFCLPAFLCGWGGLATERALFRRGGAPACTDVF